VALRFLLLPSTARSAEAPLCAAASPAVESRKPRRIDFFLTNPHMAEKVIETEGKIVSVLAGTMFRVELANQHTVLAHISGKMRKRFIRLTNGDRVRLEMSPYDLNKARITYRLG
jgi:translation initiation factor IF-1